MKKLILIATLFIASYQLHAQRYCVVDSRYILDNMPEYKQAQTKLDEASQNWQKEIDAKLQDVDKCIKPIKQKQVMLNEEMKKKREDEIIKKEKEAKELQKKRFGQDGDLLRNDKSW